MVEIILDPFIYRKVCAGVWNILTSVNILSANSVAAINYFGKLQIILPESVNINYRSFRVQFYQLILVFLKI